MLAKGTKARPLRFDCQEPRRLALHPCTTWNASCCPPLTSPRKSGERDGHLRRSGACLATNLKRGVDPTCSLCSFVLSLCFGLQAAAGTASIEFHSDQAHADSLVGASPEQPAALSDPRHLSLELEFLHNTGITNAAHLVTLLRLGCSTRDSHLHFGLPIIFGKPLRLSNDHPPRSIPSIFRVVVPEEALTCLPVTRKQLFNLPKLW